MSSIHDHKDFIELIKKHEMDLTTAIQNDEIDEAKAEVKSGLSIDLRKNINVFDPKNITIEYILKDIDELRKEYQVIFNKTIIGIIKLCPINVAISENDELRISDPKYAQIKSIPEYMYIFDPFYKYFDIKLKTKTISSMKPQIEAHIRQFVKECEIFFNPQK